MSAKREFDAFQAEVGKWAKATFPGSTDRAKLEHLKKEVAELQKATTEIDMAEEAADCLLILMHFSQAHRFSLLGAAIEKHAINLERKWGEPDADGVVEHVRGMGRCALCGKPGDVWECSRCSSTVCEEHWHQGTQRCLERLCVDS